MSFVPPVPALKVVAVTILPNLAPPPTPMPPTTCNAPELVVFALPAEEVIIRLLNVLVCPIIVLKYAGLLTNKLPLIPTPP